MQALKLDPSSAKAHYRAGQALLHLQEWQQAHDVLSLGVQMHCDHPQLLHLLSQARDGLQTSQTAQAELRRMAASKAWQDQQNSRVRIARLYHLNTHTHCYFMIPKSFS